MNKEFFEAVELMEKEKGIQADYLYEKISNAIVVAVRRDYNGKDVVACDIDPEKKTMRVYLHKNIVDEIEDEDTDILVEDAKKYREDAKAGEVLEIELDTMQFGRIAAQSAKQVITQRIREAERNLVLQEFMDKKGTLTTGIIQRVENRNVIVNIGKIDAIMPQKEQIPGEYYKPGNRIRVFVLNVKETTRLPQVIVSHAHAEIVRELFELEVPEIEDGIVEIKSISREAGYRTKIAVWSNDPEVDSVGACIGPRGSRIQTIVGELKNEKIDIVRYSEDPVEYIVNALSPARVVSVDILADDEYAHEAMVVVPDDQLSLAIGREGQNVRLAHKLTGWKIDIKSVSQMEKAEAQSFEDNYSEEEVDETPSVDEDELQQEIEEEMNQQALDEEDLQQDEPVEEEISEEE